MYPSQWMLSFLAMFLITSSLTAEQFSYGDKEPAGVHDERFTGGHCRISVYGPTGGSYVTGSYDDPNGELKITVDRFSHLSVRGRARKVVITYVDTNSSVDLTELKIGAGGVEIHSVNGRSIVEFGHSIGPVKIKSVDEGSTITVPPGTRVIGRDRFYEQSQLFFEG